MRRSGISSRLLIMLVMIGISVITYFMKTQKNPVTGESQRVSLSPEEEVAMGLQSAPQMAAEFGGLYPDENVQLKVRTVGQKLVNSTEAGRSPYRFNFHVLRDPQTVNAFALPGGQIFITIALLKRLETEDQLAGVLGHEIGHVINRHSAEHMAQQGLINGIISGVAMGGDMSTAQIAQYVGSMMSMKYGREDELESDEYGIRYMYETGYDPQAMIGVMEILAAASGGSQRPEFTSTHPSPENRIIKIKEAIAKLPARP
jgi:predicted Zn-dependent protease